MENIVKYFEAEKLQCIIGVVISVISILIAIYFLYLDKPVLKGVAYIFLPLSLLLIIICVTVIARTPSDIDRVTTFYKEQPEKVQSEEIPRMQKVIKSFGIIKKVEIAVFIIGVILALVFWQNDLIRGISFGLMIQGTILYLFDYFAELRGHEYYQFLQTL